jgi:hypothetical protein
VALFERGQGATPEDVDEIRGVYEGYLHVLLDKSLISPDDLTTYKELYPLFDPFFLVRPSFVHGRPQTRASSLSMY